MTRSSAERFGLWSDIADIGGTARSRQMPTCTHGSCGAGLFSLAEALLHGITDGQREELPGLCRLQSLILPPDESLKALCPRSDTCRRTNEKPEQGDLVILGFGFGVHPEYQSCAAVVTRVDASAQRCTHCTVAVLDPSRSFRVGECQVALDDIKPVHKEWRAGARLVIGGLQSSKMRHLNGHIVHVCEHRRHGHPCFVQPSNGRKDKLTLCVRLDEPIPDHATALLLEPRFLSPYIQKNPEGPLVTAPKLNLPDHEAVTLLSSQRRRNKQGGQFSNSDAKPVDIRSFQGKETPQSPPPPQSCSGGFLGFLSWLVEAPPKAEEEHPVVCKSTSIISVDDDSPKPSNTASGLAGLQMLHPIPELSPGGDAGQGHIYSSQIPEQGDLVVLGRGVSARYQLCSAVVKDVHSDFCNVAVLDDSRSYCVGECAVDFREVIPVHQDWRVGTRLVVGGLQSSHMRHLNGLYAIVCPHKRFGHPCLIQKPSSANQATLWLTLCLRFEDSSKSNIHGALLEPRFLTPSSASARPSSSASSLSGLSGVSRFPRAPSDVTSETTDASGSSYQKSISVPGTPGSSHSSITRSSDEERKSSLGMRGTLDVSFQKPHLPQCASSPNDDEQNVYQTHTSITSSSSGSSYQKSSSLPSTTSGRSGGIPLARMEQEVKDLRAMLKVLATKGPENGAAPNSSRGEHRS